MEEKEICSTGWSFSEAKWPGTRKGQGFARRLRSLVLCLLAVGDGDPVRGLRLLLDLLHERRDGRRESWCLVWIREP